MSVHPTRGFGLNAGKSSASNMNSNGGGGGLGQPDITSAGTTILDTLKKKMNQLKEDLEKSQDELEKTRQQLDEEKRRRECVRASYSFNTLFFLFVCSLLRFFETLNRIYDIMIRFSTTPHFLVLF